MSALPTRKQYIRNEVSHHDYYKSVAQVAGLSAKGFGEALLEQARKAYIFEQDLHLNSIPLRVWDSIAASQRQAVERALVLHGEGWSPAAGVCVAKALMIEAIMLDGKGPL